MDIDLDGLLAVTGTLDLISADLTSGIPSAGGGLGDGDVPAVLTRLQAAATAARQSRLADLTDLADGLGRVRALWLAAELANAAVPR